MKSKSEISKPLQIWQLLKEATYAWIDDYAPSMGASVSYYALFSLAPLLVIVISVAGVVFGKEPPRLYTDWYFELSV